MKLDEIKQIKIVYTEKDINGYLDLGYEIIRIFSTKIKTDAAEQVQPCIIMGKSQ